MQIGQAMSVVVAVAAAIIVIEILPPAATANHTG
jgi:hypothetical protein